MTRAVRQIVTGHSPSGRAIVKRDRMVAPLLVKAIPGYKNFELWSTQGPRRVPHRGPLPKMTRYFPNQNGTVLRYFELPPRRIGRRSRLDEASGAKEIARVLPGLLEHMEPGTAGMHTTDTVDYIIVLQGRVFLELDNKKQVELRAGDCVIQNGTRHAWHNRSNRPALLAAILLGAVRQKNASAARKAKTKK